MDRWYVQDTRTFVRTRNATVYSDWLALQKWRNTVFKAPKILFVIRKMAIRGLVCLSVTSCFRDSIVQKLTMTNLDPYPKCSSVCLYSAAFREFHTILFLLSSITGWSRALVKSRSADVTSGLGLGLQIVLSSGLELGLGTVLVLGMGWEMVKLTNYG